MSKQTQNSMLLVGVLAGGIGFMAFLMLLVVGGFGFNQALFLSIFLALVVALFLFVAFHRAPDPHETRAPVAQAPRAPTSDAQPQRQAPATGASVAAEAPAAPAPAPQPEPAPASNGGAAAVDGGSRPQALDGPRGGSADDLKMIKGVGPKLEKLCNSLGFYHFDQIAAWSPEEVAWVDENLEGFKGRVSRDNWVEQAKLLAAGGETEFSKKVGQGGVY